MDAFSDSVETGLVDAGPTAKLCRLQANEFLTNGPAKA